jgi:hypothetical protein
MDGLRQHVLSTEIQPEETPPSRPPLSGMINSLSPGQRLLLSVFLFMDVCVICFSCLLLFRKISIPF